MFVVDASVWTSRLVFEDAHHQASREWLDREITRRTPLPSPSALLPEVAGAVARRLTSSAMGLQALALLRRVPSLRLISVDADLAQFAAALAAQQRLRGADALYVALAVRLAVPLVTWDREQRERGSRVVRTLSPEEALAAEAPANGGRDSE